MTLLIYLAHGSKIKAVIMICFGLFLSTVGIDVLTGKPRFIFGSMELADGIGMVPILMGVFGITEVLVNIETIIKQDIYETKIKNLLPDLQDWKDSIGAILRGTGIGFFLGLLPGGGAIIASFASYAIEKKISKHPEAFGTGVIEGVAGPESANNAATSSGYVPLFILGIPVNPVMAMLFSALLIHGMQPGPLLLQRNPEMFWGTVMSMYIGNVILLILNLPLIGIWVRLLKIPYEYLFPLILLFCLIGSYTINNSATDVFVMLLFGMVGYLMRKFNYEGAPMVLALVLGPMIERAFIQSLNMSAGSYQIFFERPVSAVTLILAFIITMLSILPSWRRKKEL
jgi:putative tricarboxylic transport membrane protein